MDLLAFQPQRLREFFLQSILYPSVSFVTHVDYISQQLVHLLELNVQDVHQLVLEPQGASQTADNLSTSISAAPSSPISPMHPFCSAKSFIEMTGRPNFEHNVVLPHPGVPITPMERIARASMYCAVVAKC